MEDMLDTEILAFDGFDELDVVAPLEILKSAGFEVRLVTSAPCDIVYGAYGLKVRPDGVLGARPALLVVSGGGWVTNAPQGARAEVRRGVLPAEIAERHAAGTVVAGVCTGGMLLAAAGLLRGRPAVTHHSALDDLRAYGVDVRPDARVVDDGDVITSGGVTSGIDLALHLVARELGKAAAAAAAARIEYDVRGAVLDTSQG
jgi:transcriptional regulator GlxA family with amidase domain